MSAAHRPPAPSATAHRCSARRHRAEGFSLVEMLVASAIGLFLMLAVVLAYSSAKSSFAYANNTVRLSEDASFALDMMARDLRMAGYAGCNGTRATRNLPSDPYTFWPNLDLLVGVNFGADAPNPFVTVPGMPADLAHVFTARNAVWGFDAGDVVARSALGASPNYSVSTSAPMLYVAGGSSQALQLSAGMASTTDELRIATDTYNWANNTLPTLFVLADCKGSELFRASHIDAAASPVRIAHGVPANANAALTQAYGADAIITPLLTSVYFLATRTPDGAGDHPLPSLYRRHFNGDKSIVEEIIPNVEAFVLHYGVDSAAGTPSYVADSYLRSAAAVTDWSRVVSLRLGLIMASEDTGQTVEPVQSVDWLDGNYALPAAKRQQRRLYRAYSTTVAIRNRIGL